MAGTGCYFPKKSKYHSRKVQTSDGVFDSKKEYEHWLKLKNLQYSGYISDLQRQVEFTLIPKQVINGKTAELPCHYRADFVYTLNGEKVVEDVKGFKTPEYIIKRKLMLWVHGIKVVEV